ncbi:hypothetical protein KIN20_035353 [Parelaphostrongylus tenuis]|uniref:Uncharacterized protein n=1 Tax=Parelaphostrongylus tenuis TaxID=148309 RepID=A0AAD5WJV7_PARTN|nr:hypothetical protein KIN20_035353 [Parelaphostrongylus tenuis]
MIDASELPLDQEVLQRLEKVLVRWPEVRTARQMIQQLSAQFGQLGLCQLGDMQLCVVLEKSEIAETST